MEITTTAVKRFEPSSASFFRGETGQNIVEFALVVPVLLLMIIGILDLGRAVYISTMLSTAAQDGARAGTVATHIGIGNAIESAVLNRLDGVNPADVIILIDRTEDHTRVELSYRFVPATPLIGALLAESGLTLRGAAQMQLLGVLVSP